MLHGETVPSRDIDPMYPPISDLHDALQIEVRQRHALCLSGGIAGRFLEVLKEHARPRCIRLRLSSDIVHENSKAKESRRTVN